MDGQKVQSGLKLRPEGWEGHEGHANEWGACRWFWEVLGRTGQASHPVEVPRIAGSPDGHDKSEIWVFV